MAGPQRLLGAFFMDCYCATLTLLHEITSSKRSRYTYDSSS